MRRIPYFNGTDSCVITGSLGYSIGTMEASFIESGSTEAYEWIIGTGTTDVFKVGLCPSDKTFVLNVNNTAQNNIAPAWKPAQINHVSIILNSVNTFTTSDILCFNGKALTTSTNSGFPQTVSVSQALNFGRKYNSTQYFKGFIWDIKLWNYVRTISEIRRDMGRQLTGFEPGLVGYWPLNEGAGTTAYDLARPRYTKSLLHFDESPLDDSKRTWTANGTTISSTQAKFGSSSLYRTGNVVGCTTPYTTGGDLDFGTGDFTVDCWVRTSSASITIFSELYSGSNWCYLAVNSSRNLEAYFYHSTYYASTLQVPLDEWVHVAMIRYNGTLYLSLNGTMQNVGSASSTLSNSSIAYATIAGYPHAATTGTLYIDEFRITKGLARWTSNFTPPTSPHDYYSDLIPVGSFTPNNGTYQGAFQWVEMPEIYQKSPKGRSFIAWVGTILSATM